MGLEININNILRQDLDESITEGGEYSFSKDGLYFLADTIQIWLTRSDWTALAEIQIISQQRKNGRTTGTFRVEHVLSSKESKTLTEVFLRMYANKS